MHRPLSIDFYVLKDFLMKKDDNKTALLILFGLQGDYEFIKSLRDSRSLRLFTLFSSVVTLSFLTFIAYMIHSS